MRPTSVMSQARRGLLRAAGFTLALGASGHAAELVTGPVKLSRDTSFVCSIVNASNATRDVVIQARKSNGLLIEPTFCPSGTSVQFSVPADGAVSVECRADPSAPLNLYYCQFEVTGPKTNVRAGAAVDSNGPLLQGFAPAQ